MAVIVQAHPGDGAEVSLQLSQPGAVLIVVEDGQRRGRLQRGDGRGGGGDGPAGVHRGGGRGRPFCRGGGGGCRAFGGGGGLGHGDRADLACHFLAQRFVKLFGADGDAARRGLLADDFLADHLIQHFYAQREGAEQGGLNLVDLGGEEALSAKLLFQLSEPD